MNCRLLRIENGGKKKERMSTGTTGIDYLLMGTLSLLFTKTAKAVLAQLVERMAFNHVVVGSIPTDGDYDLPC